MCKTQRKSFTNLVGYKINLKIHLGHDYKISLFSVSKVIRCVEYVDTGRYAVYVNKPGNNRLSEKLLFSATGRNPVSFQFGLVSHLLF